MDIWEYQVLEIGLNRVDMVTKLNDLGEKGWEVIFVYNTKYTDLESSLC
jgi:hypothetical protein